MIVQVFADDYDLDIQWDRLGQDAFHAEEAEPLRQVFDDYLLLSEGAFDYIPRQQIAQHIVYPDHQVAAVGFVQGAGANHGEISGNGSEVSLFLQASYEVVEGGVGLY